MEVELFYIYVQFKARLMNKWKGKYSKEPWLILSDHAIDYYSDCDELVEAAITERNEAVKPWLADGFD